jgi:hypothetical protein
MRRRHTLRVLAGGAALALAIPAAAFAADTNVEFQVDDYDGDLHLSLDGSEATLTAEGGGLLDPGGGGDVTGDLPEATVTDQRGGLTQTWEVTVTGTDLVHEEYDADDDDRNMPEMVVDAENARVYLPVTDLSTLGGLTNMTLGGGTLEDDTGANLGSEYTLVSGTTLLGNGSFTYTPRMTVDVPANTPGGTYTGTVTQTVS